MLLMKKHYAKCFAFLILACFIWAQQNLKACIKARPGSLLSINNSIDQSIEFEKKKKQTNNNYKAKKQWKKSKNIDSFDVIASKLI